MKTISTVVTYIPPPIQARKKPTSCTIALRRPHRSEQFQKRIDENQCLKPKHITIKFMMTLALATSSYTNVPNFLPNQLERDPVLHIFISTYISIIIRKEKPKIYR